MRFTRTDSDWQHEATLIHLNEFDQFEDQFSEDKGKWKGIMKTFGVKDGKKTLVKLWFSSSLFTKKGAEDWLKDNNLKSIIFEAAKERIDQNDIIQTGVERFDRSVLPAAKMTPEGYIRADAAVTRTGIFQYRNEDGSTRNELRSPDEVFNSDSLESLQMIPVTNGHPVGRFLNADNSKELSIGSTGEKITHDDAWVYSPLVVNRKDGVNAVVKMKRKELSLGYHADLEMKPGVYQGKKYDCIQRNIRYNHLAIVDSARAGSAARLYMDEAEVKPINHNQKRGHKMPNMIIDGISYEAEQQVVNHLDRIEKENGELKTKFDSVASESVKLKATCDEQKTKIDGLEKIDHSETIQTAVQARIDLVGKANKVLDEEEMKKLDGKTDKEIQVAAIVKVHKDIKLDDATDDYIAARFDAVIDNVVPNNPNAIANQRKIVDNKDGKDSNVRVDAVESRNKMVDRMKTAYKPAEAK